MGDPLILVTVLNDDVRLLVTESVFSGNWYGIAAENDVDTVAAVRDIVGDEIALMVDYNQSLTVTEAVRRINRLAEYDLHWVEEPVPAEDIRGHAEVRAASPGWFSRLRSLLPGSARGPAMSPEDVATNWVRSGLEISPVRGSNRNAVTPPSQYRVTRRKCPVR